ncbi:MAG: hypothetical protein K2L00_03950 [Muribaculaceae bacterium]|nr:hypothetical protein [Muribaculaceae bacterium]
MKKIFTIILAFMALALPMTAQESDGKSKSTPVALDVHTNNVDPNPIIHRAPMRICVEAWHDETSSTLFIIYDGEAEGEVNLYRDGELIGTSSVINTSFMVSAHGFYTIEIIADSWTASGDFEIE